MMNSRRPPIELLQQCMLIPSQIRNVCVLAHVDHGKTTIADSLLAANRLVSKRMAGSIRYLDDRIDEQERGITMKSSAVSLVYRPMGATTELLLNLIDTPGHIDFSTEVSAALKVCDGAVIVVDTVEGVCVQTREAIKQAFTEKVTMILVLNKIDKLIVELRKSLTEIFYAILHTIENCNAIIAELYQYEEGNSGPDKKDLEDQGLVFSPLLNNIIFASAIDGWGFTLKHIATLFNELFPQETVDSLQTKMWDFDCYADTKNGTVKTGAIDKSKHNLFTQLCLKTVFDIYTTIVIQMDREKIVKIADKLHIHTTRDMNHNDAKIRLKAIMQEWCPLAETIFELCERTIPAPISIPDSRIYHFLNTNDGEKRSNEQIGKCFRAFKSCRSDTDELTIVYVSKMFCVNKRNLSQNQPKIFVPRSRDACNPITVDRTVEPPELGKPSESSNDDSTSQQQFVVVGLARVFNGALRKGQEVYVLQANNSNPSTIIISELYVLLGRELHLVDEITAGNICGIGGIDAIVLRTATLSTNGQCIPIAECPPQPPIVRNTIEPVHPKDLPILRKGLRLLMHSDSCVQVQIQDTGEHVLLTSGDVHLTKCLEDLTSKFAQINVQVSSPIVSIRETVTAIYDMTRKSSDSVLTSEVDRIRISVCVVSLPENIAEKILNYSKLLHSTGEHQELNGCDDSAKKTQDRAGLKSSLSKRNSPGQQLDDEFEKASDSWATLKGKLWSISKTTSNSINVLINNTDFPINMFNNSTLFLNDQDPRSSFNYLITTAFQNCCKAGPICEEPLQNCAFIVNDFQVVVSKSDNPVSNITSNVNMQLGICAVFRKAFEKQPQRILEPVFVTDIQVNTSILGKVYSVVNKRHGKILEAVGMDEQEKVFLVKAQIPVVESIGFANEIRKSTSGQAIPNLKFSHFELIDGDPYFELATDDNNDDDCDDDDNGVQIEAAVRATKLRKEIRKRKGLTVEEQIVVHGEKQRTLNRKK